VPAQRYVIGIDLGTTNSALAYAELHERSEQIEAEPMLIPQLTNPGEVRDEALLPSSLYIPGGRDFPAGSLALPWNPDPALVVGRLAQKRGSENTGRLVSSAKSWLSHAGVDRTAAILPRNAPEGVEKISPVDASTQYLAHLHSAWNAQFSDAPFVDQDIYVTVPASFDAVARELTLKAAERAGCPNVTLLEEPQAAFYAWIERHADWRERVGAGDLILVVDIGGGTTDFTLIAVTEAKGELTLERVAVGEHILLGGDNIDLALAHTVAARLTAKGTRIDAFQMQALWNHCRAGKEALLDPASAAQEYPVTILGKGSGLVGGTIKAALTRADVQTVLESFFPLAGRDAAPEKQKRSAIQEIGLPYATDAAVTRHLAHFLAQQRGGFAQPTHVLFNGGVLHAPFVRDRLLEVLNSWVERPVQLLSGEDLMQAVARGAAYYGAARRGRGVRIRGGIPRSYYIGVESAMPAVPGFAAPLKAFTVASFGMEEGTDVRIPGREFGLVVGEPAEFRIFSLVVRKSDAPGTWIEEIGEDLQEMPSMEVHFPGGDANERVRVSFETVVTETGMLQLWCVARDGRRWKLEFNVRERVAA
jgi:molecular chaperone DnaK (HSP70)